MVESKPQTPVYGQTPLNTQPYKSFKTHPRGTSKFLSVPCRGPHPVLHHYLKKKRKRKRRKKRNNRINNNKPEQEEGSFPDRPFELLGLMTSATPHNLNPDVRFLLSRALLPRVFAGLGLRSMHELPSIFRRILETMVCSSIPLHNLNSQNWRSRAFLDCDSCGMTQGAF